MPRYIRVAVLVTTVLLLYLAWKYVVPEALVILNFVLMVLTPFILAAAVAILIEPLVRLFCRRLNRSLAVALAMLVVIGGLGGLLTLLILRLVGELNELSVRLPHYAGPVQDYINHLVEQGKFFYFQLPPAVTAHLQKNMGTFTDWLSNFAGNVAVWLLHLITTLPNAVTTIVVALVATYFVSRDRRLIVNLWLKTAPEPWGARVLDVARQVVGAALGYIRAQSLLITLTTVQSIAGLYLIGAQYSLTIGLLIGLMDLIPVLGPASIYIPWAVWALFSGHVAFGLKLLFLYLLVWAVRQVLEARVVAANLGLHPLAVLLAMYVGLKSTGVAGLILGPLALIALQAAVKTVYGSR